MKCINSTTPNGNRGAKAAEKPKKAKANRTKD